MREREGTLLEMAYMAYIRGTRHKPHACPANATDTNPLSLFRSVFLIFLGWPPDIATQRAAAIPSARHWEAHAENS